MPDEISVVGCDDISMSAMTHPALTTVSIPKWEAGRAAVALLLSLLAEGTGDSPAPDRELSAQLIVRATTGVAPATSRPALGGHSTKGPTG